MIMSKGNRKIGFLGFSFKSRGLDDLRESPLVEVIERLIGKGFELRLYDRNVNAAKLLGANRGLNHESYPAHFKAHGFPILKVYWSMLRRLLSATVSPEFKDIQTRLRPGQVVVDFGQDC